MGTWSFSPSYDLTISRKNPDRGTRGQPDTLSWHLRTLSEFQGLLATTNTSSQATITLNDPTGALMDTVNPQPMDAIIVRLRNRHGVWAGAWAGYLDECREIHDPSAGRTVSLKCRGPYKKWEVGRQSAGDVLALAMAGMRNVAGAEVVRYSARAVGYNPANITFDPVADSGTGLYPSIAQSTMTNPDQQTWSAPVQQMLASSGLEFFFDEDGYGHYRRVGFLGSGQKYIPQIPLEDVLHADLGTGDTGLVTSVSVRWGPFPTIGTQATATAPQSMADQLGTRPLIIQAQWLLSQAGAQYLADTLLDQYASGAATASVIVIADPATYRLGTLVDMPGVRKGRGVTRYYVTSVTYLCQWGGQWVQTLGLNYGRAPGNRFPYIGGVSYPVLTADPTDLPQLVPLLAFDPNNTKKITSALTVQAQPTLAVNQASSSSLPVGAVIELRQTVSGGGQWVGPSHQYMIVAAPQGQDPGVIGLRSGSGTAYATVITYGSGDNGSGTGTGASTTTGNGSSSGSVDSGNSLVQGPSTRPSGTYFSKPSTAISAPTSGPRTLADHALQVAYAVRDEPDGSSARNVVGASHYILGTHGEIDANGVQHWDCSGLVQWSYAQCGRTDFLAPSGPQYSQILAHGGRAISVNDAQPGDLLFIGPEKHVGFCWKAGGFNGGQTYGANNNLDGLCVMDISTYSSGPTEGNEPFDRAISMQDVTLTS